MKNNGAGDEDRQIEYWAHMLDEALGVGVGLGAGGGLELRAQVTVDGPFAVSDLGAGDGYSNDFGGVRGALRALRDMSGGFDPGKTPVFCLAYTGEKDASMYCVSMTSRGNPRTYEVFSRDGKAEGVFALASQNTRVTASAEQLTDTLDFSEKFVFTTIPGYHGIRERPDRPPDRMVLGVTYKRGRQKQIWRMVEKIVYAKSEDLGKIARVKGPEYFVRDDMLLLVVREDRPSDGSFVAKDGADLVKDSPFVPWRGRVEPRGW